MSNDPLASFLKDMAKSTGAVSFAESKFSEITEYIDTGDLGLNRLISGSIYKGIPAGRVVLIAGESQSGKTVVVAKCIVNAIAKNGYDAFYYFDCEGGALKDMFLGFGGDISKIHHIPIFTVEDATVKILTTVQKIVELKKKFPQYKIGCALDSLGGLVNQKVYDDAEKDKQVQDMGAKAKKINTMVKGLTMPCLAANIPFLITNHIYDDPAAMYKSKIQNQAGGRGAQYMARITLQCRKTLEKDEKDCDKQYYKATVLTFTTAKNSIVKPYYTSEMFMDFDNGTEKYYGLVKPAIEYGFIQPVSKIKFIVPSYSKDKEMKISKIVKCEEIWNTFLDAFDKKSMEEMSYSSIEKRKVDIEDELEDAEEDEDTEA